jgi:Fibronectin type III domain
VTDSGTNVARPFSRVLLGTTLLVLTVSMGFTVLTSVPASAHAPRIKKPGAPTAVTAVPLGGGAEVSWAAPTSDGGSPVTSYVATASHGGQTCNSTVATTCTVSGLTNGRLYTVRVRAVNAKGNGAVARVQVTPSPPSMSFGETDDYPYTGGPVGVELSQPSTTGVQVDFTNSGGPSVTLYMVEWVGDAADFSPNSGIVTFAPGQTTATIPITVVGGSATGCTFAIPTCLPSLTITLSNPTGATLGSMSVTNLFYDG